MILRPNHFTGGRQAFVGGRSLKQRKQSGFVLVAVLIVVMLASMVVVSLLFRLHAEETAMVAGAGTEQAWSAAMSGVYQAMQLAANSPAGSLDWQDNPTLLRNRLVVDEGSDRWYYSVYSRNEADRDEVRFGLTDEASKLNLNEATAEMLEKLPRMTPYLVEGLLDFLDSDDTPRPEGAEQEYYSALPTPYRIANGPLATLDELLLVRGFTPALLYGEDANWNFLLDANEDDADAQFPPDNKDGKLDCGVRPYLTVKSYDLNQDNNKAPRVNLNEPTPESKGSSKMGTYEIPPALVTYLEAMQRHQVKVEQPADLLEAKGKFKNEEGKEVELESGVGKEQLPLVLDHYTTQSELRQPGLINVNTASAAVLKTLPGMDEALADSFVAARRNLRPEQRQTSAWLYQEGLVDSSQFKKLSPYVTARAFQFHCHVVGYGVPSGRYRVLETIFDVAGQQPAIIYLRDITRLGLPFRIDSNTESEIGSSEKLSASSRTGAGQNRRFEAIGTTRFSQPVRERAASGATSSSLRAPLGNPLKASRGNRSRTLRQEFKHA